MDLKAIILVGGAGAAAQAQQAETIAEVPLAYLDVLGATVLERVVQRLRQLGLSTIALIGETGPNASSHAERAALRSGLTLTEAKRQELWSAAEDACERFRQDGADFVLVVRLGAYVEIEYEELIQHHIDKHCRMTSVVNPDGDALGIYLLDLSRRGDATALFRSQLQQVRDDCERFQARGYINPLRNAGDLRVLALDGLLKKNAVHPAGEEIKPGIWAAEGARIHRKSRVVAPAFIGAHSKVRAAALLTRGSVIEHHAEIDCGTVVENSTVLPFTYTGAGLDVMHSVVGFRRLSHLVRNVEVEVTDAKLIGLTPTAAVSRVIGSAAALFAVLPQQMFRAFFDRATRGRCAELPEALEVPAATLEAPDVTEPASGQEVPEFPSNFAVVRRYGEHW
jgi:hypothetical protein